MKTWVLFLEWTEDRKFRMKEESTVSTVSTVAAFR